MKAIEFGSGRSTVWFAKRVNQLLSVEHDESWYTAVQQKLKLANAVNVDYRLVKLDHPYEQGEKPQYSPVPRYVSVADTLPDRSIHLAIVDGHYRTHCIKHIVPKIATGGLLLVDDINLWPSVASIPVPAEWQIADDNTNGIKRCVIWRAE